METERSLEFILPEDLEVFASLAATDRRDFFSRYQRQEYFLCSALCQGAAQHFVDRVNGVKDIDIWSFFVKTPETPDFPVRRRVERDLGPSKFGVHPDDARRGFTGRRVDLLGRSLTVAAGEGAVDALHRYLREARTDASRELSKKAVVILEPRELRGVVVWPE